MAKKQDYEVLMTEEGFWFGRLLKNGTMSADSVRIDDGQITNMLAAWFERHCAREQTDELWITKPDGAILVKQFTSEQIQEAATKANRKVAEQAKKQARPQVKVAQQAKKSSAPQAKKPAAKSRKKGA